VRKVLATIALAIAVTACSDSSEPVDDFESAEGRWEEGGNSSYAFTAERSCFCTEEGRGPVRITVVNGTITSVLMTASGASVNPESWFTIDGLFDLIREQMETLPSRLEVEYHGTLGYPTKVTYGTPENDGGGIIFVRDVVRN
jgi:hypothetical protein